ncbi:Protein of uncharacterised function DUF111 [uncultured Clostridium sp.]|nr:Protein of uncharacterised function DUF111 [uncultured Clostridium sp.]
MKTLYLECNMGASGDMLMGALYELLPDGNAFLEQLNALGLPGVRVAREESVKCGIHGTHMAITIGGQEELSLDAHEHAHEVHHPAEQAAQGQEKHIHAHEHEHEHEHSHEHAHEHKHHEHEHGHSHEHTHSSVADIAHQIGHLPVSQRVKQDALAVYGLIAQAEAHAHGVPVEQIHFHEVGTVDALADIVGVCLAMEMLSPDKIVASPINLGSGQVHCAHGILPVPAPATAHILMGLPVYGSAIRGELCTPTGAALLRYFATEFGPMPGMRMMAVGYGMGNKDFPAANCVRAVWGE